MAVRAGRAPPPLRRWAARVAAQPHSTLAAAIVAMVAAAVALGLAVNQNAGHPGVLPEVAAAATAALGLWAVCGYPLARLLVPAALGPHLPLLVVPVGAAASGLLLAVLGLLHVPFKVSLALVVLAALAAGVLVRRRLGPLALRGVDPRAGGAVVRLAWPAFALLLVLAVVLIPLFRAGAPTVLGQNGDAVLATETVEFVQKAPPTARRYDRPADRVPLVWRSKLPIFYSMGATATLSGLTPLQVFAVQAALVLGLAAIGWFLFAFYALGAGPWASLAALAALPLNRMMLYVADHPFYNETWGMLALPFILLFGVLWLRRPSRRRFALFALFAVLGACAYPLMLVFPAAFLTIAAIVGWRRARREGRRAPWSRPLRLPHGRRAALVAVPLAVVAVPVVLVLGRGVGEKLVSGLTVLLPGRSLRAWSGAVPYFGVPRFVGLPDPAWLGIALAAAVTGLVAWALWRAPRDVAIPALAVIVAALLFAIEFRLRAFGQLFYFKELGFMAPIAVTLGVVGLADLVRRAAGAGAVPRAVAVAGAAGLAAAFVLNDRVELAQTYDQSSVTVRQLASWSRAIPSRASVRIDVAPSTYQLWAYYFFSSHPLSCTRPIPGMFPHPPVGLRSRYLLVDRNPGASPPADAQGPPIRANRQFALYEMKPSVPGPDRSSRRFYDPVTKVSIL